MKNLIQNFKRPLLLTAVATMFAAGLSDFRFGIQSAEAADIQNSAGMPDSNAESRSQEFLVADGRSVSDSDIAAQNWDTPGGPDTDAVAPSNDIGMVAEKWRSLEQPVVSKGEFAAKNWNNPGGPDADAVAPSNDVGMAAAEWRSLEQPVVSQSEFAAENWKNPGDVAPISNQSSEHDMATKSWGVER